MLTSGAKRNVSDIAAYPDYFSQAAVDGPQGFLEKTAAS
jgi:hypothetical protein